MGGDRGKELSFLGDGDGDTDIVFEKAPEPTAVASEAVTEPVAENKVEPQPTEASNG